MLQISTDTQLDGMYAELAALFTAAFPARRTGPRTVGREAEYPVVNARGEAVDARRLWNVLLEAGDLTPEYGSRSPGAPEFIVGLRGYDYGYALEVGLGTIEINSRPCRHLLEVQGIMVQAVQRLVRAAARFNWRVLGYGIQPMSPPSIGLMSPKQRYLSLYRAMGEAWLWYTVTASDQLHVAIGQDEMVMMLNYGSLVTPVIIALCGNSPIYAGRRSPFCSAREGVMAEIRANEHRHGMLAQPVRDMVDFVATMARPTHLIMREGGQVIPSVRPFAEHLLEHGVDYEAFLFHEHYIWNSARLRAAYGTLELRPACQQPWSEHMAVAALELGLVEAQPAAEAFMRAVLGETYWQRMHVYHQQAIRFGLAAPQPAPDFLITLVQLAEQALIARRFGEEILLAPIWSRLERGENPAQRMRTIFQADGMAGLVAQATIGLGG